jgi:hypothetical protein
MRGEVMLYAIVVNQFTSERFRTDFQPLSQAKDTLKLLAAKFQAVDGWKFSFIQKHQVREEWLNLLPESEVK